MEAVENHMPSQIRCFDLHNREYNLFFWKVIQILHIANSIHSISLWMNCLTIAFCQLLTMIKCKFLIGTSCDWFLIIQVKLSRPSSYNGAGSFAGFKSINKSMNHKLMKKNSWLFIRKREVSEIASTYKILPHLNIAFVEK